MSGGCRGYGRAGGRPHREFCPAILKTVYKSMKKITKDEFQTIFLLQIITEPGNFYHGVNEAGTVTYTTNRARAGKFYDKELAEKRAHKLGNCEVITIEK